MKTVGTPGGRMAYVDEGSGTPVVLVHGTPSSSREWRAIINTLAPRHRVLAPDHLGFGASDRPSDYRVYSLDFHTRNLRAWLDALELPAFHLVVHDFGGPVALPLALEAPERVRTLTIIQSWLWDLAAPKLMGSALMRWLYLSANFSARVLVKASWGRRRPLTPELHRAFIEQFPDRTSRAGTWGFARSVVFEGARMDALGRELGALSKVPSLVIWGNADGVVKPEHLARWRRELPGSEVLALDDVGHFPQLEAPEAVGEAILRHMEKGEGSGDAAERL